jgi:hypothetical protein
MKHRKDSLKTSSSYLSLRWFQLQGLNCISTTQAVYSLCFDRPRFRKIVKQHSIRCLLYVLSINNSFALDSRGMLGFSVRSKKCVVRLKISKFQLHVCGFVSSVLSGFILFFKFNSVNIYWKIIRTSSTLIHQNKRRFALAILKAYRKQNKNRTLNF